MFGYPYMFPPFVPNIGYGANVNSKSLAGFNSISATATMDLLSRQILISQSRQLVIQNGIASAAIDRYVEGVVGQGLSYVAPENSQFIGELYPVISDLFSKRMSLAAMSGGFDGAGHLTLSQMQRMAVNATLLSGEVFYARKPDSYAWTAIEADRCMSPYYMCGKVTEKWQDGIFKIINPETGFRIIDGVEIDHEGREVAYWILKEAIEKPLAMTADQIERIPAEDPETGLPLCLHLFMPTRPSQWHGVPLLAPVIQTLFLQSGYLEAEQNAAALEASCYAFVTSQNPARDDQVPELASRLDEKIPVPKLPPVDSDDEGSSEEKPQKPMELVYSTKDAEAEARRNLYHPQAVPVTSGTVTYLGENEDIKFMTPQHPSGNFQAFWSATSDIIASAVGLPAEVLKLKFDSSYSASRAALLMAESKYKEVRSYFISRFMRPLIQVFCYETLPSDVFSEDERQYMAQSIALEAEFRTPSMPCIDQRQELEAWKIALELGICTRDDVAMAMFSRKAPEKTDVVKDLAEKEA